MPVDKQEPLQVLEPRDGEIGGHHGLHTLHSGNTHTNVSSLKHKTFYIKSLSEDLLLD